jgi:hypothetical protein
VEAVANANELLQLLQWLLPTSTVCGVGPPVSATPLPSDINPLSSPQLRIITVDPPSDAAPSAEIAAQEAENWTRDLRAVQNDLHRYREEPRPKTMSHWTLSAIGMSVFFQRAYLNVILIF